MNARVWVWAREIALAACTGASIFGDSVACRGTAIGETRWCKITQHSKEAPPASDAPTLCSATQLAVAAAPTSAAMLVACE